MKKSLYSRVLLVIFILLLCRQLPAQSLPAVKIILSPQLQHGLQVVYASDLDILDKGVADYFFDVEIWNVQQSWEETHLILKVLRGDQAIAILVSTPFYLPVPDINPGNGPAYRASNIDLLNFGVFPGTGIDFDFSNRTFKAPSKSFETLLAESGKIERGRYFLQVILANPAWGEDEIMSQVRLDITNPSLIRLQSPSNKEIVYTEFPHFQYESDAPEFIVSVYKQLNQNDDIETILSGHPTLEYSTSAKQFNYNTAGGDPLESGATYYWFVRSITTTTNGLEDFISEVWQFTVDITGGSSRIAYLKELLSSFLGPLADQILQQLADSELKTIRVNGATITLNELIALFESYQNSDVEIQELEIR